MRARTRWFSKVVAIFLAPLLLAQCGGPGDAVQLAFTSTPQLVTSGRPFSVVVQARDRSGQGTGASRGGQSPVVISLSLGAGPPAAALGGPDSATADSDGNASFQALLDIPGPSYTLVASAPALPEIVPVTSSPFSVVEP